MSIRREMGEVNYFKNFNMGREIEIAGEFIYESMREMYSLKSFSEHFKINKILYNGAVGIERLQKILLCMFLINQTATLSYSTMRRTSFSFVQKNSFP